MLRKIVTACLIVCCASIVLPLKAADSTGVSFTYGYERLNDTEVNAYIKAFIPAGQKLYSLQTSDSDLLYSNIVVDTSRAGKIAGKWLQEGQMQTEADAALQTTSRYFADSVIWMQRLTVSAADSLLIKGSINYLCQVGDAYLPGEEKFKIQILPAPSTIGNAGQQPEKYSSLLFIFLTAFGGGLLALLTPCVYSMIPVTVSFFTKRSKTRSEGIKNALYYSTSIVVIFTLLGFLTTLIFGPAALNNLATNWIANLVFFALFLVFGISFLGAFEIALPSSWTNKADSKAGSGNFWGIFFMALTLALVSFSCTGPIIGNLLVLAAKGSYWGPLTGMFGFSLALALPFALFAFFPSKLNVLGKAGGWLNAVKVTLGFLELALALKFLSNADLAKGWRLLDREVFIAAWVVIFILLGIYLLGKIRFHHDDDLPKNDFGLPYLTVTRLGFAMASLIFAMYLVPGMWGAPLKAVSAFVPPMGTQDFVLSASLNGGNNSNAGSSHQAGALHPEKYYDRMKVYEPEVVTKYGLVTYFDYDEALAAARAMNKPLMLDFTGINCVNCRKMEGQVWSDPEVMKRLKEDFVIVSLYVDVHNIELPESEQYFSTHLDKQIETLGDKNADKQVSVFGANTQPYYFFLDANEQRLMPEGYGYDPDIQKFIQLLDTVKEKYASGRNSEASASLPLTPPGEQKLAVN